MGGESLVNLIILAYYSVQFLKNHSFLTNLSASFCNPRPKVGSKNTVETLDIDLLDSSFKMRSIISALSLLAVASVAEGSESSRLEEIAKLNGLDPIVECGWRVAAMDFAKVI